MTLTVRLAALVICCCALLLLPGAATAAPPSPHDLRVDAVRTHAIVLKWRDVLGESRYELRYREPGEPPQTVSLPADTVGFTIQPLPTGTVHYHWLRACDVTGCSPWSERRVQATLLAPFGDPYPTLGSCELFPAPGVPPTAPSVADLSAWNQDVSASPVHPRSTQIVGQIEADGSDQLHPDFGGDGEYGIPYVVVPGPQPGVPVRIGPDGFPDESDFGLAPVPPRAPIEGGSDDHVLVVDRDECELYELYVGVYLGGVRNAWQADSTAYWDLGSTALRTDGNTSADAAGLPILPGLVRYDEVAAGEIDHAIRVTFEETSRAYIHPATHYASSSCNLDRPPMGLRLRMKASYDISGITGQARVIAIALKRYGMINADNGSNLFITGAADRRWDDEDLEQLKDIPADAFEVVSSAEAPITPC